MSGVWRAQEGLADMVGWSAKAGGVKQVPRAWKAEPEVGRMGVGGSGTRHPKAEFCFIGPVVFIVCVLQYTTLATSTGKTAGWGGSKNSLGPWETDQGRGREPMAWGRRPKGVWQIPFQCSQCQGPRVKPRGGEGQSIETSGWPHSKSGRKNKMKKKIQKSEPSSRKWIDQLQAPGRLRTWLLSL